MNALATHSPRALNQSQDLVSTVLFAVPLTEKDQAEYNSLPEAAFHLVVNRFSILERIHYASNQRAAARAAAISYGNQRGYSATTLLNLYYQYMKTGDWHVLVDRARAKIGTDAAQPADFIAFWRQLCQRHKRSIVQARAELLRIWTTGYNDDAKPCSVPGYGTWRDWFKRHHPGAELPAEAPLPPGWGRSQLYRLKPKKAERAIAIQGNAAAREFLPHNLTTRDGLRFLEKVTFDDVKLDWRVIDERTGEVMDLWLLVAIDRATGCVLGYWMRPARKREDGSQQHLTLRDMKQLCAWVLWTWGLPPYPITWKLERGTATLAEGTRLAIGALLAGRVQVSFSSMIGGKSPSGYQQRALGNSRGKAGHEATNNLVHNICDNIPGQTGPRYDRRPADLLARERHALDIWATVFCELPEDLRDRVQFPLFNLDKARAELNRRFNWMNARTDHALEGYEAFWEWRENPQSPWRSYDSLPPGIEPAPENRRKRKHSPLERAHYLREQTRDLGEWTPGPALAPLLIRIYDTHRKVRVNERHEIEFDLNGKKLTFALPPLERAIEPNTPLLAWYNEQFPRFIHLSRIAKPGDPAHNGYVATAALRERARDGDTAALQESLRYTAAARAALEKQAADLGAPEASRLVEIDTHNAALLADAQTQRLAIDAEPVAPIEPGCAPAPISPIAVALDAADAALAAEPQRLQQEADDLAAARDHMQDQIARDAEIARDLLNQDDF